MDDMSRQTEFVILSPLSSQQLIKTERWITNANPRCTKNREETTSCGRQNEEKTEDCLPLPMCLKYVIFCKACFNKRNEGRNDYLPSPWPAEEYPDVPFVVLKYGY